MHFFPPLPYVGEIHFIFESEFTVTSSVQRISSCTNGKRRKIHPFMKLCSKAKLKVKREFIVGLFFGSVEIRELLKSPPLPNRKPSAEMKPRGVAQFHLCFDIFWLFFTLSDQYLKSISIFLLVYV